MIRDGKKQKGRLKHIHFHFKHGGKKCDEVNYIPAEFLFLLFGFNVYLSWYCQFFK